jgi:glycosyltransferase 2 family protein
MLIRLRRLASRPWVRLTLLAVVLCCCGYRLHAQWPQVVSALDRMRWYSISLSIAAAIGGSVCMMLAWRAILADLGSPLPARIAGRINFTSQLGKYVPGAVWAFAAQVELGHDYQVPRRRSFASVVVSLAVTVGVGLGLALVLLSAASPHIARHYWWALAVLPLIIAALCPPVLGTLLDRLLAVLHRAPLERRPSFPGLAKAVAWNLAGWLLLGLQVWILLPGIAGLHGRTLLLCIGGFALAFSVGLMLVVLPSGIGARDLILIAALATLLPYGAASAIAIMTRLGTTVTDLGLGAVGIALGRRALRPAATAALNGPSGQPTATAALNGPSGQPAATAAANAPSGYQ